MEYEVKYSKRLSLEIQIDGDGKITVRAPYWMDEERIDKCLEEKKAWIEKTLQTVEKNMPYTKTATESEESLLRKKAQEILPEKIKHYSELLGVHPVGFKVTGARRRLGSCSSKDRLCFSFYIMRRSDEEIDYVVVHELCHLKHFDHSQEFYDEIEAVLPNYKELEKKLKGKD